MSAPQPVQQPAADHTIVEPAKPSNRVYCRWEVTDDSLKEMFAKFGVVAEARVVRGPRLRAFGFVTFESEADAAKAIAGLNGKGLSSPMTLEYANTERGPRTRAPRARREIPATTDGAYPAAPAAAAPREPRQPRERRPRQPQPQNPNQPTAPRAAGAAGAEGAQRPRRRRNRRLAEQKDPNWGKVVSLIPDPIRTPLAADAKITELVSGARQYRPGFANGKVISSLILNADPTKGPFNCDFRLGEFDLKLLNVKVNSKPDDCRISARILHTATNRSREVYLRVRSNGENRHKFFELVKPGTDETAEQFEVYFVGLDSIQLDTATGLWKKIVLSLVSAVVPRRVPRALAPATTAPVAAAPAPVAAIPQTH